MKYFSFIFFLILFSCAGKKKTYVDRLPKMTIDSCHNAFIDHQADSLVQLYAKDNIQLIRNASVSMESQYEVPIIVTLTRGTWYQFAFLGEYTSKLYEVRIYDWNEKLVIYKRFHWGDVDGNVIAFGYIPRFSEPHIIRVVQVNKEIKDRKICGRVMLFKKNE